MKQDVSLPLGGSPPEAEIGCQLLNRSRFNNSQTVGVTRHASQIRCSATVVGLLTGNVIFVRGAPRSGQNQDSNNFCPIRVRQEVSMNDL